MPIPFMVPKGEKPWAHQLEAHERASRLDSFGLFFEQGCGKTATLINILREKYAQRNGLLNTLIICPPIVVSNWVEELARYSEIPHHRVIAVEGMFWMRCKALEGLDDAAVFVTAYSSLYMKKVHEKLLDKKFDIVVLDESHKIKNHRSKAAKACFGLSTQAKYRYCLSGTPVLNEATDLFSQFLFLDHGKTLGNKFNWFREDYYFDFNQNMPRHCYFPNWKMKPGALKVLNNKIKPLSMRKTKAECLDLPPLIRQKVVAELTPEQNTVYNQLQKEMVAELKNGTKVITDLVITKLLRLQQLITGFITNEEGKEIYFEDNHRQSCLQEVLESLPPDAKVLIWAVFRPNYQTIRDVCAGLGLVYAQITGEMSQAQKQKSKEDFISNPKVRVLIGHPSSAGIGINLVVAPYSIFYSRSFSLEQDLQAESRNHRAGSERHEKITRIDIVTPGTIDEVILEALSRKQTMGDAILSHYLKEKK